MEVVEFADKVREMSLSGVRQHMNEDTLKRCTSFASVCHLCEGHMERYKNDDVDSIMPL